MRGGGGESPDLPFSESPNVDVPTLGKSKVSYSVHREGCKGIGNGSGGANKRYHKDVQQSPDRNIFYYQLLGTL